MAYKWAQVSIYRLKDDGLNGKKLVIDKEKIIVDEQRDYWNEVLSFSDEEKYHYFEIVTGIRFNNNPINESRLEYWVFQSNLLPNGYLNRNDIKMKLNMELLGNCIKMNGYDNRRPLEDVTLEELNDYYRNFRNTKFFKCLEEFDEKKFKKNVKKMKKELKKKKW